MPLLKNLSKKLVSPIYRYLYENIQFFQFKTETMQSFDHPHIIKIVGMSLDEEKSLSELAIVMELAKFGQLRVYLHTNRDHIETITLTLYCFQLSSALAYLESKKIVHR